MTMQRLASRLAIARRTPAMPSTRQTLPFISTTTIPRTYGTSSSPKSAEKASAQSGGSRSKEATEKGSSPTGGILGSGASGKKDKLPKNSSSDNAPTEGVVPDELANGKVQGRTGGGEPLSSSQDPPKKPKVDSHALPGGKPKLTKEQQAEVDEHNRDFEAKHGRAQPAQEDKVDSKFWGNAGDKTGAVKP